MVKKYLVVKLCLMLLAITAMPLPVFAAEEVAKVPYTETMYQNQVLKGKEQPTPKKVPCWQVFLNRQWDEEVQQPEPLHGKGFLQSRFYLSNYLER